MPDPTPRRPLPPPLVVHPPGLWRTTPPALFAPILGLFGLGLLLRTLAAYLMVAPLAQLAEALLGAVVLLHAFAVIAYLAKPLRRPASLIEDMAILPGRGGLSAAVAGLQLSAAALVPYAPALALAMALGGLVVQLVFAAAVAWLILSGPVEGRVVSPFMHLTFVGPILSPFALVPLGWSGLSEVILWLSLAVALPIWVLGLARAATTPAPLRPVLVIHLAPASVSTSVAALLGLGGVAMALGLWAVLLAVFAVARSRWILAAGFSPFWGALTFPLAAFGQAAIRGLGEPGLWLGAAMAGVAIVAIPWIAWRILKDWPGGTLARRTNASIA